MKSFTRLVLACLVTGLLVVFTGCGAGISSAMPAQTTPVTPQATSATLEQVSSFNSTLPSGWSQSGWAFSDGAASGGSGAWIHDNSDYGIDQRTISWTFQLGSPASDVAFYTQPVEASVDWGSMLRVDMGSNELWLSSVYGGAGPCVGAPGCGWSYLPLNPSLASTTLPFTLAPNRTYVLTWTRLTNLTMTASLTDPSTGLTGTLSRTAPAFGYNPYPEPYSDQGDMEGGNGVSVVSGSARLLSFEHQASQSPTPTLYILGDSITDDYGNQPDDKKYGALLRDTLGATQVVISGIPGATATGAIPRLQAELANIQPKNVLIYLGTNADASFSTSLKTLVSIAQAAGAKVLVATIASSAANTAIVNALQGVTVVHFDLALTASGAGSALNASMYNSVDVDGDPYNDWIHPNAAGHAAMAARVLADAPFLKQ